MLFHVLRSMKVDIKMSLFDFPYYLLASTTTDELSFPSVKPIIETDFTGLCFLSIVIFPVTPSKSLSLAKFSAISV